MIATKTEEGYENVIHPWDGDDYDWIIAVRRLSDGKVVEKVVCGGWTAAEDAVELITRRLKEDQQC